MTMPTAISLNHSEAFHLGETKGRQRDAPLEEPVERGCLDHSPDVAPEEPGNAEVMHVVKERGGIPQGQVVLVQEENLVERAQHHCLVEKWQEGGATETGPWDTKGC